MSWCGERARAPAAGLTFIELLVVLVILSLLATLTLPYAEMTVRRSQEVELRRALRTVREAIDRLHQDWSDQRISRLSRAVSERGYPRTLAVLVEGVETGAADGGVRKYLRRIPADPFSPEPETRQPVWALLSYTDPPDAEQWGGEEVYDIRSLSEGTALDGSLYHEW